MNISKTLFKNLSRCPSFSAYYDMYLNRFLHEVREIDGLPITNNIVDEVINLNLTDDDFSDLVDDKLNSIFSEMFDDETGEDLTIFTNAQMEAFKDTFTEVERLASIYIEKLLGKKVIASTDTYSQKKYSYQIDGNTFYCYLDIYYEDNDTIKIFEVKATTSKKYDDFQITVNKEKFPLFIMQNNGIMKFVGDEMVGMNVGSKVIEQKQIDKKKTNLFNRYSKEGKYIYDLSVERHIVENSINQNKDAKKKNVEYYLVVLNAEYRFDGTYDENNNPVYEKDKNGNELFKTYDMTSITEEYQKIISLERDEILERENNLKINTKCLGKCCDYKKTTQCKFYKICMKNVLKDGSILEYLGKNYAFKELDENGKSRCVDVFELINQGLYMIPDARDYLEKQENITQYECYINNETYMDKERIKYALQEIKYPIYHLDFESYNCPLPRFKGEKPYDQSVFQYSLHKEATPGVCDIVENHTEFLAKDHLDHRKELVEQMIKDIDLSNGGCVMVYNKSFEKTRMKEFTEFFPEYKKEVDNINDNIFDLLDVLKGNEKLFDVILPQSIKDKSANEPRYTYYHNNMHGSFSIKKILPLFTNLTYSNLVVKNGTEAIVTYGQLPTLTEKEYNEKYLALRIYCRQDTWAMVEILRGLRKAI